MIPESVRSLLDVGSPQAVERLLDDQDAIFLVDWREEDEEIVNLCEGVLQTGELSAEVVDIDEEPHFELYITYRDRRVKVPVVVGVADRHITLHTLNEMIKPAYEIRVCVDSNGSDTLALLPMSAGDWAAMETQYGAKVAKHFRRIEKRPNLFTERWS